MPSQSASVPSGPSAEMGIVIQRIPDVLMFTLDNGNHSNEVTGAMFDAMLEELRSEATNPVARVLRIRARGKVFCTGRERAGHDAESLRKEAARLVEFKHALRTSPLISVAEVQGDAFGFGFGLAIVCDFVLVAENASLAFPEMRFGLAPAAIMAYLGEGRISAWIRFRAGECVRLRAGCGKCFARVPRDALRACSRRDHGVPRRRPHFRWFFSASPSVRSARSRSGSSLKSARLKSWLAKQMRWWHAFCVSMQRRRAGARSFFSRRSSIPSTRIASAPSKH